MAKVADSGGASPDIWRRISPEEKLELMAKAHSKGIGASLVLLVMTGTVAVGLRFPWVFWAAFLAVPFVFQFVAAKAWRDVKPRAMLEYLAARSAARRYAYGAQAQDLAVDLMFRGYLERARNTDSDREQEEETFDPENPRPQRVPVWVAVFRDTLVAMSEQQGGARLEFAHPLFERFQATAEGFEEKDPAGRRIKIEVISRRFADVRETFFLTSDYPASLLACERKIKMNGVVYKNKATAQRAAQGLTEEPEDNFLSLPF
jgi:hypothetical protein